MKYIRTFESFTGITHDNGGRPFVVYSEGDDGRTFIYKQMDFLSNKVENIFKGEGNSSILLEMEDGSYYFIGDVVYTFETDEKIIDFKSPIGNSDVAYPYAESENYYYILGQGYVYFKKPEEKIEDVYKYYYDNHNKNVDNLELFDFKNFNLIQKRLT